MTKEEARIIILEDALIRAYHQIEFLQGCIELPNDYKYESPHMTDALVVEIEDLVELPDYCTHSMINENCPLCIVNHERLNLLIEAKQVYES